MNHLKLFAELQSQILMWRGSVAGCELHSVLESGQPTGVGIQQKCWHAGRYFVGVFGAEGRWW